jgi:hypothetical protein
LPGKVKMLKPAGDEMSGRKFLPRQKRAMGKGACLSCPRFEIPGRLF